MPTILDTLGIATCAVSYGKESSFAGRFAATSITITPKAIGVGQLRLIWAATGDIFTSFTDQTIADSGTVGIITLPQTGQDGFKQGTSTFKNWYYEAVITAVTADGQALSRVYRFQIPAGVTTMDIDALDEDGVVTALPAIAPVVAEPAGLSTTTRASLAATFLQLRSTEPTSAERAAGVVAYIDRSVVPPVLKGWDGSSWVGIGGDSIPDNTLTTDSGEYLVTDTGDYLIYAA